MTDKLKIAQEGELEAKIREIFSNLDRLEPGEELYSSIKKAIILKKRIMVSEFVAMGSGFVVVLSLVFYSTKTVFEKISQSGTIQFFSLLFSDFKDVLANWKSFSLYILESLPTSEILLSLTGLFILFLLSGIIINFRENNKFLLN